MAKTGILLPKRHTDTRTGRPRLYKVIYHNDDFTPMNFVAWSLMAVFHKSESEAGKLTLAVHNDGIAVVDVCTFEVAEMRQMIVMEAARKAEHPLQVTIEPEDPEPQPDPGAN
jgi:ATP-dependent Clp protease adaptor protein ClpS